MLNFNSHTDFYVALGDTKAVTIPKVIAALNLAAKKEMTKWEFQCELRISPTPAAKLTQKLIDAKIIEIKGGKVVPRYIPNLVNNEPAKDKVFTRRKDQQPYPLRTLLLQFAGLNEYCREKGLFKDLEQFSLENREMIENYWETE